MGLQESFLFKQLKEKSTQYAGSVENCWDVAQKLLLTVAATHPTYTSHGPDHALAVLNILDLAIEPLNLNLNEEELYILISATLLHDIGMVGEVDSDERRRSYIRNTHHIRTKEYIKSNKTELGIERKFSQSIAEVASAHRKLNIEDYIIERKIGTSGYSPPRTKLCSALLRMADECHLGEDRIAEDYGVLDLPEESLKHFQTHFNNLGTHFDKDTGEIKFTVEICSREIDTLYKSAKEKIQSVIDELKPIFQKHHVPYSRIVMDEIREDLIKHKIIEALLSNVQLDQKTLVKKLKREGEDKEAVKSFLEVNGEAEPFEFTQGQIYKLHYSESVFYKLAEEFLFNTKDINDWMLFIKSELAQTTLSDNYLNKLLKQSISISDPKDLIFRIIRESPSALHYIIQRRTELPRKRASGQSGIIDSLKGELQNDFLEYPDLLLEPGLLDDVFGKNSNSDVWRKLKVRQIAEYHKAFDTNKLFTQWCAPNEWERKAHPQYRKNLTSFRTTFKMRKYEIDNPMHLMIASHRMKLPCRFEETEDFKIEGTFGGKEKPSDKRISMIKIKFGNKLPKLAFPVPARMIREKKGEYVIELKTEGSQSGLVGMDYPLLFWMYIATKPKKKKNKYEFSCSIKMVLNSDLLDCEQAALLLKAKKENISNLKIKILSNKHECLTPDISSHIGELFSLPDKKHERVLLKLGSLQRLIKRRIPVPLYISPEVESIILGLQIRSRVDAERTWHEIIKTLGKEKKYFSPISTEIIREDDSKIHRYYNFIEGVHQPGFKSGRIESDLENVQERIDETLNDPKKDLEFVLGYVPLSAEATIEYLDENSPQTRRPYVPNVESLKKIVTESPEEYNTRIRLKWLPEEDRVWHRVTPFIIYLEHMSWERWLIEAEFLNRVKKDNKRAYIANREAFRVKPDDANVVIGYGWSAFRCRRLKEAIEVTKLSLNDERNYIQFMANINMGLYYLDMAASNDDEEAVNLDASKTHYEKAIQLLNSLEIKEKTIGVHAAIEDILEYRTQLHTKSEHYLKMFQEYEQSN
jgi:hypothetical protein